MSQNTQDSTGKAGVVTAPADSNSMDKLVHSVLDDLLYNIVHDLLLKTHRDEKMARAATAAIRVEKLASDASDPTSDTKPDVRIETEAAVYEDGKTTLKTNPLKTTHDIVCPRCHLPRLLYPTDGKGARKVDTSIIYCKKHPYIDKQGFDIYGQSWVAPGPGRGKGGKKKKENEKTDSPTPDVQPKNQLSFPSATCSKCKRCILVTRLNNHMGSCIGNSGRNASRAAAQKISNGGSNGTSQNNDNTPPSSQKGTPLPGSRAGSPRKRDVDEFEDDDESGPDKPKKKLKPLTGPKKVILKSKSASQSPAPHLGLNKKDKAKGGSLLSNEQKVDDDSGGGGDPVKRTSTSEVLPPKKAPKPGTPGLSSPAKKLKLGSNKPRLASPSVKNGTLLSASTTQAVPPSSQGDAESESSGTLSSPPAQH